MAKNISPSLTKTDLDQIETTIKKALQTGKNGKLEERYVELLEQIVQTLHDLKITVEFEHERRLQAIEEFLQDL